MNPSDQYPALALQRGMILGTLRRPTDGVDIQQITVDWSGPPDRAALTRVWQEVTACHAVLRTAFHPHGDDGLVQVVAADVEPDLRWLAGPAPADFLLTDRFEPFDPGRAPLARVTVFDTGQMVLTFHHALMDGRSFRLLLDEIFHRYADATAGRPDQRKPPPPYAGFVHWWLSIDPRPAETFWREYLSGVDVPRPLPGRLGDSDDRPPSPQAHETGLTAQESDRLRALATEAGASAAAVVNAAWALLRAAYAGTDDITFAVTRSARYGSVPGADDMIGMLITTVPLRVRVDPAWTVRELVADVAARTRQVREHQLAPLASILDSAGIDADPSPLDSLVIFERERTHTSLTRLGPEPARASVRVHRLPSFPLTLYAFDEPAMRLTALWDGHRIVSASARHMLAQLRDTLRQMVDRPAARVGDLDLGVAAEAGLRAEWNATGRPYPRDATLPDLFEARVAEQPDAPAVVAGDDTLSYAELDRDTRRLARVLAGHGVGPDVPVAVALPRGADLIRALLGVLRAGGAYLPLDLAAPPARTAAVIAASGARLTLTDKGTAAQWPAGAGPALDIEELLHEPAPDGARPGRPHPQSLAYIGYTSGSTGTPKGVAVPHRAVVRLICDPDFARLGPGERVLHLAPAAFDASTLEIWGALGTGATVVVAPPDPVDLVELAALLRGGGVSVAWLTAGLFHQLADMDVAALGGVGQVLTGGDVINPAAVRAVLAARGGRPLVNGYGPTENTTFTTCHVMTGPDGIGERVPIGRPVHRTTVHVLDEDLRPVPVGVVGELCTGGDGLARGYLGNPAATARAFIPDPDGGGGRLYRTGDLARWRADGVLEFLGRRDNQVKIRGFRVEPAEVEAVLAAHPDVGAAAVVVRGEGAQKHLAAYVSPAGAAAAPTPGSLRDYLAARLPSYLVPAAYAVLDRLPLNANGKVDRAALPDPAEVGGGTDEHAADGGGPATPTEQRLAGLWSRLLPGDPAANGGFGRDASFFRLGGNSLTAARLVSRARDEFGVELGLGGFYDAPTLASMAATIDAAPPTTGPGTPTRPAIRRRARDAYRVAGTPEWPEHLAPLTPDWALWRTICLRGAGFPADLLSALGDEQLARAADRANAAEAVSDNLDPAALDAYAAEFTRAERRLGHALRNAADRPDFREAITWQNPHALSTGVDVLRRRDPDTVRRNSQHRQHETLVASYLQRYCAKNDTIGFFGPVGWASFAPGDGVRIDHAHPTALVSARTTYLEGWAVTAVLAPHTAALRPWLVPRRMPFVDLDGASLRVPLAPPLPLTAAEAAVLRACDGIRDARAVATTALADPHGGVTSVEQVYEVLEAADAAHRIAWRVEVPSHDPRPESAARAVLDRVTDAPARAAATAALDELCAARDALAAAAGDPTSVAAAAAQLADTFTRLAGVAPTRRAGGLYAGRTPVYEECRRADVVEIGEETLDGARAALGLVLDSARWFTAAGAALYRDLFEDLYRRRAAELGTDVVPFADFWMRMPEILVDWPTPLVAPLIDTLQRRWAEVLALPTGSDPVTRKAADLSAAVAAAFPADQPGWPTARQHSPDLMIATGRDGGLEWVLGELHPGLNTLRYATWIAYHPRPAALRAAMASDLGREVVFPAETNEQGGVPTRQSNVLAGPHDLKFVFAHDSFGHDPARTLLVGACDIVSTPVGLRVRRRDGQADLDVVEVLGDLIAGALSQMFRIVAPGAHTPRVTIDGLVVSRESWTFQASELTFAGVADEARRYREARAWAARSRLPRYVFVRSAGEQKPVYADLTGLASIDLVSRAIRRARRHAGDTAPVTITEMLPAPDQLWLTDGDGRRYSAELRVVAVDRKAR